MKKLTSIDKFSPLTQTETGLQGGFSNIMASIHLNSNELGKTKNECTTANNCGTGRNCQKCGYDNPR
jgi:hypothetical protein